MTIVGLINSFIVLKLLYTKIDDSDCKTEAFQDLKIDLEFQFGNKWENYLFNILLQDSLGWKT